MTRGFSSKEVLLGLAVFLVATSILFGAGMVMSRRRDTTETVDHMRRVYVALSLYEESVDGMPAPNLFAAKLYLPEASCYQASGDPYLSAPGPYPVDGSLPDSARKADFRISLGYLWAHRPKKPGPNWDWKLLSKDLNVGFLVNEWLGDVKATGDFGAQVSGRVLRVNRDGSLLEISDRGGPKPLGDIADLFGIK